MVRATPAIPPASLTVVVPVLNEAAHLGEVLARVRRVWPQAPMVVADGGSSDGSLALARAAGATALLAERGRGVQCAAAARQVTTDWMLFLHADTLLPDRAAEVVARFCARPDAEIATFRLRFDDASWFLRACGWFTRFDSVFTRFGDQGILIRRSFYVELGGFPAWPLFEDVALLQQARRRTQVVSLPAAVTTSARRFRARGPLRQQWLNACLVVRYLLGASPHDLAAAYRQPPAARHDPAATLASGTEQTPS